MSIRVLLVDDQPLVRSGMAMLLTAHDDITVVGEAGDGALAVNQARALLPDVVVMDVLMPGDLDGVAATRELTADDFLPGADVTIKVLMVTSLGEQDTVFAALRAGASGFLLKDAAPDELAAAVREVHTGHAWLAPSVTPAVIAEAIARPPASDRPPGLIERLTERERQVLTLIAHGMLNDEIARHFVISEATVRTHVNRIFWKLEVRGRAQAVVVAYRSGLVTADSPPPPPLRRPDTSRRD